MNGCASGSRCVAVGTHPDLTASPLCAGCTARAAIDIGLLPRDYLDLAQAIVPARHGPGQRVGGGETGAPVPIALGVEALQREIHFTLTTWEPVVREAAGLSRERSRNVRDGWAVATAALVIAPRVPLLAAIGPTACFADGWAAGPVERTGLDAITELRRLHRTARHTLGLTRDTHTLPGDCSACGASALRRADGSDTVWCDLCDARWTLDDYRRYVGLLLATP